VKLVNELMKVSNMFGYGEVNQYNRTPSTLMRAYQNIKDERFSYYILKQKSDVFQALKRFFSSQKKEAVASH